MPPTKPHVVIVVADDMGYSDLGCYGGEIATPTLDRLGRAGVRLSRFYNTTRCSPSRASMLTGLHPHQAGIGILTSDDRPDGYRGSLNRAVPHPRGDAARGRLRDLPERQVAPDVRRVESLRRLADPSRLRPVLRHALGLRQLLPPDDAHARRAERRERGGGAGVLLHRRHHATKPRRSSGHTPHTRRIAPSSSTRRTPRRTGRCTRRPKTSRGIAERSTRAGTSCARRGSAGSWPRGSCRRERR